MVNFTWLDFIFLLVFLIAAITGLKKGFVQELISLVIIVVALVVTVKFATPLARLLYSSPGSHQAVELLAKFIAKDSGQYLPGITLALSIALLFVGTTSIIEAVNSYVYPSTLMSTGFSFFYRLFGGALGLLRGYIYNVLLVVILSLSPLVQTTAWSQSYFIPRLANYVNQLSEAIQPGGLGRL